MQVSAINFNGSVSNSGNRFSFGETPKPQPEGQPDANKIALQKLENNVQNTSKVGVGIASLIIPGLGQGLNGQWGKGAAFFVSSAATIIPLSFIPAIMLTTKNKAIAAGLFSISAISHLAVRAWAVIDAVKNAGKKE